MQREWKALGHPAPLMKNDRAHKAFDLFIPGLDKEVDMASDLMKALFGRGEGEKQLVTPPVTPPVAPPVTPAVATLMRLLDARGALGNAEIRAQLGLRDRTHLREHYISPALAADVIEMTIPEKPHSRLQKYRLTQKGVAYMKNQAPTA